MYSQEIYKKAERILKKRQDNAQLELEMRTDEIKAKLPEIAEIQSKLSRIGLEISKIFFYKGNADEKIKELKAQSEALVAQRKKILSANGYSENAMSIEHICPACEDRGFINGRLCACHRQLLKDIMKEEIRRLAPIDSCTFDSFELAYYSDSPMENAIVPRERAKKILKPADDMPKIFRLMQKICFLSAEQVSAKRICRLLLQMLSSTGAIPSATERRRISATICRASSSAGATMRIIQNGRCSTAIC